MTEIAAVRARAQPLPYATGGESNVWSGRAVRLAFLICGLTSMVSLICAVCTHLYDPSLGGEAYDQGIQALRWMFSPASGSSWTNIETQPLWPEILALPIPLLLLIASGRSERPRLASAIRIARLLAAGLLIGVAIGKWRSISIFDDGSVLELRERLANAVRLLALDYPLVPLLSLMGLRVRPGQRAIAVAFGVVLASYSASMCLSFGEMVAAVFDGADHGGFGVTPNYTGIAGLCESLFAWLISGMNDAMRLSDSTPPLHTLCLLWGSAVGALIAAASMWSRRAWLRRIGAATLLPAVIVCVPGRLLPWFDVSRDWLEPGDQSFGLRLLNVGGYVEIATATLPLVAFAMAAFVTLMTRPIPELAPDACS